MTEYVQNLNSIKIISYSAIAANETRPENIFNRCLQGNSAIDNETGLGAISEDIIDTLKETCPESFNKSRSSLLSYSALMQGLQELAWGPKELSDCGFIFATTTGQIDLWQSSLPFSRFEKENQERILLAAHRQSLGYSLLELQKHFKINGPSALISSSCSASLQALAVASLWIRQGKVKRCVVGATEILSNLTLQGFQCLRLLTKEIARPFDKDRRGINLGEASSFFCLEAEDASATKALAWISGVGFSTDAFHPTAPHPEGKGSAESILKALKTASIKPNQIDWIHAHGTGSVANDLAEFNALKTCFANKIPPVTSTKPIHGHTLGASGALESTLIIEAFKKNIILPNSKTIHLDDRIQLDLPKAFIKKDLNHVLKNSLGFGGINTSVIFSKHKATL